MKEFTRIVLVAAILMVMPIRNWAQDYRSNQTLIGSLDASMNQQVQTREYENGFLFNVFEIENVEERVQLASALATSDIWLCNPTDNPGELYIRPNSYHADIPIYAEFDYLRATLREEYNEVSLLPKEEFAEIFNSWAHNISHDYYNFLTSDHLDRANHCMDAEPFCTSDVYNFPAVNSGYSWSGPNYGCLGSSPTSKHSFWYYMRIGVAGNITIKMEASFDVDFALWGPFNNQTDPCPTAAGQAGLLTADCTSCPNNTTSPNFYPSGNLHDCSFSAQSYEYAHIVNGQVGQYYILLITNYAGSSGNITFQKHAGDGETDCGIMPPLVENDGPYCVGQTINLTANGQAGSSYSWTGPNGFTSNQQNPSRPNCTMAMAGTYTCTITLGGASNSATTDVVIYPQPTANFTATSVCQGNATQFTSTSTTNPSGQNITSYQWDFGDGQTSTQQNPSHTYTSAGTYTVTLTVGCGNGHCTDTKTQTVTVYAAPSANAGPDQTIGYGGTAQLSGQGGAGTFNYHWEPANMVLNANAQNTQTVSLTQDQTYTLTVTNPQGGCSSSDEVTIHINGSAMSVSANATPSSICQGSSTQLQANAGGGTGNFTYSWTPTTGLNNPNIYNPTASPTQTTTYTCTVGDGQTTQSVSVTVTVNYPEHTEETHYICPGDTYEWHDQIYSNEGNYDYYTTTAQGCEKIITLHLRHYPTYDETTIDTAICHNESFDFYGTSYNYSIYNLPHTLYTSHGCDSIVRLNLTVWPENEVTLKEVSVCPELLPYYFYGEAYNGPTDVTVYDNDIHGCDSAVRLVLTVSDYYKPEEEFHFVCYPPDETPSFTWTPIEPYSFTFHENIEHYTDTLPTANCDGIFSLSLYFMPIPEVIHTYDTACDNYDWYVNGMKVGSYAESTEDEYRIPMTPFPCDQVYQLHLVVNHSDHNGAVSFTNECDSVYMTIFGEEKRFYENGQYTFEGSTSHGCDSTLTVTVNNMRYSPIPQKMKCTDASAIVYGPAEAEADTIAVVTNTEFFSFQYSFFVEETNRECIWDSCLWTISKPSWAIEYDSSPTVSLNGKYYSQCMVYVADRTNDYVELTATIKNGCGIATRKFYLKSSFLDVDEHPYAEGKIDIIPNPNNGQMQLRIENMEGKLNVKVCNLSGMLVDEFDIKADQVPYTYNYAMKRLSNGVYFFVINDGKRSVTKKVVIIQ